MSKTVYTNEEKVQILKDLMLEKEKLWQECNHFEKMYLARFATDVLLRRRLDNRVCEKRLMLNFCKKQKRKFKPIIESEMNEYVAKEMGERYKYYEEMEADVDTSQSEVVPSEKDLIKLDEVFARILFRTAYELHPDYTEDDELFELRKDAIGYYDDYDLKSLMKIEKKINKYFIDNNIEETSGISPLLDEYIKNNKTEIQNLKKSESYRLSEVFESDETIHQEYEDLNKEIEKLKYTLEGFEYQLNKYNIVQGEA